MIRGFAAAVALVLAVSADVSAARDLRSVQADIIEDYPGVAHLTPQALSERADVLLFDVREEEEFAVSRLDGAIQLDPDMDGDDFVERYGDLIGGRVVVFYCSVGVRSARMADRLAPVLGDADAVWNLEGGAFAWHNDARPMENAGGKTPFIHPYNRSWGKLVDRTNMLRTEPQD